MFSPIVENKKVTEAFITAAPQELPYQDKNLPAIIGCTSEENIPTALSKSMLYDFLKKTFAENVQCIAGR